MLRKTETERDIAVYLSSLRELPLRSVLDGVKQFVLFAFLARAFVHWKGLEVVSENFALGNGVVSISPKWSVKKVDFTNLSAVLADFS